MNKEINVLSLFDGMSCGQIALSKLGFKINNYYASEIDKYAMEITKKNFPNTIQIGDVTKVNGHNYNDIDILMGGSPCFVEGTKVLTKNGYKCIENIKVGDYVLTHKKRFKKVLSIGNTKKDTCVLKIQGIKTTETTDNHPYYILSIRKKWNKTLKKYIDDYNQPKWTDASKLKKGDYIGLPIIDIEENPRNLTEEECWLLGRYIADGHYRNDKRKNRINSYQYQVIYSIGSHKLDFFKENVKNYHFSSHPHTQSTHRCIISSMKLVNLIKDIGLGKGAINKKLPVELLNLPKYLLQKVLDGYLSGDESFTNGLYQITSISEDLILSLNLAIAKTFNVNSSYIFFERPKTSIIEGRIINQQNTYSIHFRPEMKPQSKAKIINGYVWLPFKNYDKTNEIKTVYNIEVEEDNSYTANNAIVHNCQNLSRNVINNIKHNQGLKGEKSQLFYEFLRILTEVKPKYFMLENVGSMSDENRGLISEALDCDYIEINSNLVSGQDRSRYFWTNIPNITLPNDKGIVIEDILLDAKDVDDKYWYDKDFEFHGQNKKIIATLGIKGHDLIKRVYNPNNKCGTLTCCRGGNLQKKVYQNGKIRKLTPLEYERLQTVPDNYTEGVSDSQRYNMLGNGWTVDVIKHIFSFIPIDNDDEIDDFWIN